MVLSKSTKLKSKKKTSKRYSSLYPRSPHTLNPKSASGSAMAHSSFTTTETQTKTQWQSKPFVGTILAPSLIFSHTAKAWTNLQELFQWVQVTGWWLAGTSKRFSAIPTIQKSAILLLSCKALRNQKHKKSGHFNMIKKPTNSWHWQKTIWVNDAKI